MKIKILLLGDPMANTKQWIEGLEKYGNAKVVNWHLHERGKIKRIIEWFKTLLTISSRVKNINPDIIIGYRLTSYGFLAAWSGFHPLILAAQGSTDVWPKNSLSTPFKALLAKYAISRADMIHAWGEHMVPDIIKHGGKRDKILVMPRGVDTTRFFPPSNKEYNITKRTIVLSTTRGLYSEYGHMVILEAFKKLIDNNYKLELNIAGSGPEQQKMMDYITANNLQNYVHMLGFVHNDELPHLLRRTDIYLSMPDTEGVSNSLFEAMACGCLPIVSDLPANRSVIVNRETGLLVPVGNSTELYNSLITVINDPVLLTKAVERNNDYIQHKACLQNNIKTFIAAYTEMLTSV